MMETADFDPLVVMAILCILVALIVVIFLSVASVVESDRQKRPWDDRGGMK